MKTTRLFIWFAWTALGCISPLADADPAANQHWSFQPPQRPLLPEVRQTDWPRHSIDYFILARLEQEGIAPSAEADRRALIRRLSLDLLGLPPAPSEVRAFVEDDQPGAYERLVDRLLASPHFGERWARHWLDLARYADSDGYEKDGVRPHAWTFRDWVIQAINQDLPFDQFSLEQLAGDLLPNPSLDQKIATGFHRNTLTNREGGVDQEEFRAKAVVDRANTTATVWLGLTLACAECHNHKYDPISQREYFQFYAFFNSALERDIPAPRPEELEKYLRSIEAWEKEGAGLDPAQIEAHQKKRPKFPETQAQTLAESENPLRTFVHLRGDFLDRGEEVQPGTFSVLHPFNPDPNRPGATGQSSHEETGPHRTPDRLDLARWLLALENPLTARVTVNRIWGRLFGRPLVVTDEDFGARGEPPSHPELLDWLASEFPRLGWRRKALIREIVTSSTYRQSSHHRPELLERDPENRLLARQNRFRLEAETIRDLHLAAGGLLDRTLGGPGIRPPLPTDIAALGYANSVRWEESSGSDRYRRGLYIFFQRTVPYPLLAMFDAPDSNETCTRRQRSNTPLQALTLLNDPVFFECAQELGRRAVLHSSSSAPERLAWMFERCLSRLPDELELNRLEQLYTDQLSLLERNPERAALLLGTENSSAPDLEAAALVLAARSILNLDEFISRE